jgi:hypothetical protein
MVLDEWRSYFVTLRIEGEESDEEGRRDRHHIKSASYFLNRPKTPKIALTTESCSYTIGSLADATVLNTISFDSFAPWLGLLALITYCFYLKTSSFWYNQRSGIAILVWGQESRSSSVNSYCIR